MSSLVVRRRLRNRRNGNGNGFGEGRNGNGRGILRFFLIGLLGLFTLGAIGIAAGVGTAFAVYQHYAGDYVPIEDRLRQAHVGMTEIYDRGGPEEGQRLGHLSNPEAQLLEPVPLEAISDEMVSATISTEDNSFWSHQGVNPRGLVRAAYENYVLNEFGEGTGGSSITQQLVKNVYICPQFTDHEDFCPEGAERTADRKLREIAYALELERDYDKEQILGWYLNQISYAGRYVGVQAAAQGYFDKDASELELHEAALLAGIPQSPGEYHPRPPEARNCVLEEGSSDVCLTDDQGRRQLGGAAKDRQEDVIDLMASHGHITEAEAEEAKQETVYIYPDSNPILAPEYIDNQIQPRLVRMCEAGLLPELEHADDCISQVHSAGYQVTTSLDWDLTQMAQDVLHEWVEEGLANNSNAHNASIVMVEPQTGEMTVYAPNRNTGDQSDPRIAGNIDQAVEIRQPGSALKPLIYLTWMDALGKHPLNTFWDTNNLPVEGGTIRNPRSDSLGSEGLITAQQGLGGSQNVPSVRAAEEASPDVVLDYARRLGMNTLAQGFDPTFLNHDASYYGPAVATGGANIRVADLAYLNATFANMGEMVGTPHLADEIDMEQLRDYQEEGIEYERAEQQAIAFQRGNLRLEGSRNLDPITVLEVRDASGEVVFEQGEPEREQVIDAGSAWLLNSVMTDCSARVIIWQCGSSNTDTALDFFANGQQVPAGVKTGTQQGPQSDEETLSTWMAGYSRYAASAVWLGNANNELVNDGPPNYASARTTIRLYKHWMAAYHEHLQEEGIVGDTFEDFSDLQPDNVEERSVETPATDRGRSGGCDQTDTGWVRTDIDYESECETIEIDTRNGLRAGGNTPSQFISTRQYVPLPDWGTDLARSLARAINDTGKSLPIAPSETSDGGATVSISAPANGSTITGPTTVVGTVGSDNVSGWTLEIGQGGSPSTWTVLATGASGTGSSALGTVDPDSLPGPGVYTIRLRVDDLIVGTLSSTVQVNVQEPAPPPPPDDEGEGGGDGTDGGDGGEPEPTPPPDDGDGDGAPGNGNGGNGNGGDGNGNGGEGNGGGQGQGDGPEADDSS